jgi:hypothetical protein
MNKSVYDIVYNYPTKYQMGFTNSEIEEVLKNFPNLNREFYSNALYRVTCMITDDEMIDYIADHTLFKRQDVIQQIEGGRDLDIFYFDIKRRENN